MLTEVIPCFEIELELHWLRCINSANMALELQEGLQMCADNMDSTNAFSLEDPGTEMAPEG